MNRSQKKKIIILDTIILNEIGQMESTLERTHARIEEEEDLLVRSNKKVRADDNKPEV